MKYKPNKNHARALGFSFWEDDTDTSDRAVGLRVLQAYYNEARGYSEFTFQSFEEFLAWAEIATTLATDIGELIKNTYRTNSESDAIKRIRDLAYKSKGTAKQGDLIRAAGGTGNTINWFVAIPEVSSQVATDVVQTASTLATNVGTGVLGTLNMVKYLPILLLGAGGLYIYLKSGSSIKRNPRVKKGKKFKFSKIKRSKSPWAVKKIIYRNFKIVIIINNSGYFIRTIYLVQKTRPSADIVFNPDLFKGDKMVKKPFYKLKEAVNYSHKFVDNFIARKKLK